MPTPRNSRFLTAASRLDPPVWLHFVATTLILCLCPGCDGPAGGGVPSTEEVVDSSLPEEPSPDTTTKKNDGSKYTEVDMSTLQYRRSEFREGTNLKVSGEISRISYGEPTKEGPHFAVWLDSHVYGDGFYDVECLFESADPIVGLTEGQTVTLQGTRAKSYFGVQLADCRITDRGDLPEFTAQKFDKPIFESKREFPESPEGLKLKSYLPWILEIHPEGILDDGSLDEDYLNALAESTVVRNVELSGEISNKGLKQIAALKGMKELRVSSGLGGDPIDLSELDFSLLASHPRLRTLILQKVSGVSDETLTPIGQFQCLASLALNSARGTVTDAGLAGLANLKSLRSLTIPQFRGTVDVTDEGLGVLAGLPYLQELRLRSRKITGRGFASLKTCPRLEVLRLRDSSVTTEGLTSLEQLPQLRYLELDETEVDDGFATTVSKLTNLEHLSLGETEITDAFFEAWQPPPKLVDLGLSKTKLTDRGVELLCGNPPPLLRTLELRQYTRDITAKSLDSIARITTLKKLIVPRSFDDDARKSLTDRGLIVQ